MDILLSGVVFDAPWGLGFFLGSYIGESPNLLRIQSFSYFGRILSPPFILSLLPLRDNLRIDGRCTA